MPRLTVCLSLVGLTALCLRFASPPAAATSLQRGPSPEVQAENHPDFVEMYRLRIENKVDGKIEVSRDEGRSWRSLGKVVRPTTKVTHSGFTASKWALPAHVCATAVNAIHLKTDDDAKTGRGVVFSLVPVEQLTTFKFGAASDNPSAAIYTNIPGGTGIFGRWPAFVNGRVLVDRDGKMQTFPVGYVPQIGDVLVLPVERVKRLPKSIEFENRFGGLIRVVYPEGTKLIGEVLRPVLGVGRFEGSLFADVGRIRANHPGVLDICTTPYGKGKMGGFQIVPANHAMSPETTYIRQFTQWMVVGPLHATDPSWEGTAPLFSYFMQPRYDPRGIFADDWVESLLTRFRVEVKMGKGDWQPMPSVSLDPDEKKPLPSKAFVALKDVTHIRILFPDPLYYSPERGD